MSLASTLVGILTVVGIAALFSTWSMNRAWQRGTEEASALRDLEWAAMETQTVFKVQVQEWKNILLRGTDTELLQRHRTAFESRQRRVHDLLIGLRDDASELSLTEIAATIEALQSEHDRLRERYGSALDDALAVTATLSLEAATSIDRQLRGIDRDLEARIDALATTVGDAADQRQTAMITALAERYQTLRLGLITLLAITLVVTALSLHSALRATRD